MNRWVFIFSDFVYMADVLVTVKYMPSAKPSEHYYALRNYSTLSLLREQALTFECQRNSEINNFLLLKFIAQFRTGFCVRVPAYVAFNGKTQLDIR